MKKLLSLMLGLSLFFVSLMPSASAETVRIMAANITSGNCQCYDSGEGIRILQGLKPDIVLIQEWNYRDNSDTSIRQFVDDVFGEEFSYFRERNSGIPNGVISRFPIIDSGELDDNVAPDRDFAYAIIDIPGDINLSAVSVHLLTNDSSRPREVEDLINDINGVIAPEDYLVIGGDFNTDRHNETALRTLNPVVNTNPPYPVDQDGKTGTNASRRKPYDGVYFDSDLTPLEVPVIIGENTFDHGLVFDSRVYQPLADVSPVERNDSGVTGMQHMAVIRDFNLPESL